MDTEQGRSSSVTTVLETRGLRRATEKLRLEAGLSRHPGVLNVEANPVAQTSNVTFDPVTTSVAELRREVEACGCHCEGQSVPAYCCDPLEEPRSRRSASHARRATAPPAPGAEAHAEHERMARDVEHEAPIHHEGMPPAAAQDPHARHGGLSMEHMVAEMRTRFLVAAAFSAPILLWSSIGRQVLHFTASSPFGLRDDVWQLLLSLPVILYAANLFYTGAIEALRARTLDMNVLVAVAIAAGWGYSVIVTLTGGGDVFYEAATVLAAFVLLGHWFEMRARGGANDAIRQLLNLAPPMAFVLRNGEPVEVPTTGVVVGDLLQVRPGAKIPVDGIVEEGESEVDESTVTGESLPVSKKPGSEVIGATINRNGTLRVRTTRVGSETALAQIVKLVQEAQNSKAPGQRLADRAAFWLVLVALVGGSITFLLWFLAGAGVNRAILFAITVVVITCPDALGLATPTAIMVGAGLGAKRGILFKNAQAIESAARVRVVVMDKTGTLTLGQPEVTEVVTEGIAEPELVRLAAAVERESEHPLAEAIVRHADSLNIPSARAESFENVPGEGACARVGDRRILVGNLRLMSRENVALDGLASRREQLASAGRTVVVVAVDGRAAGLIAIADAPRPTSKAAVDAMRRLGVRVVMLTGDNQATAERIAATLGIDEVIAEVLPADKASKITELQNRGLRVAMVGDGVNDAPALAQADLGVAIGAGTDVAIETADVVLMRSDPLDVPTALTVGRGTLRKMRQNLAWAVGYNGVALPIAAGIFEPAFGLVLRPEIAALSMSGSSLLVAVNALLLRRLPLPAVGGPPSPTPAVEERVHPRAA